MGKQQPAALTSDDIAQIRAAAHYESEHLARRRQRAPGAGRPPIVEGERLIRVTVTLPASFVEWARQASIRGNVSEGLRTLLGELDERQGAEARVKAGASATA